MTTDPESNLRTLHALPTVWMYGGGTQTAAIAALIKQGRIPTPDWTVVADTGREKQSTWDYLENVIQPAMPFKIHRILKRQFATVDLFRNDTLLIPVYSNQSGELSKLPNFCTNEWKVRVCNRWLRTQGVKKAIRWIGFSYDEPRRYMRMRQSKRGALARFPLVDFVECTRAACLKVVADMGWPTPPRSSCWMCPNMKDAEWLGLTPEEFEKAADLDEWIRTKDPNAFLHRQCVPLRQVEFKPTSEQPRPCDSGVCFV